MAAERHSTHRRRKLAAKPGFRYRLAPIGDYLLASRQHEERQAEETTVVAAAEERLTDDRSEPRTFLCHSSGDKARVRELYNHLRSDGIQCWFDEVDLRPGRDWHLEITKAIEGSKFVLACLSESSINKRGYIQRELKKAQMWPYSAAGGRSLPHTSALRRLRGTPAAATLAMG